MFSALWQELPITSFCKVMQNALCNNFHLLDQYKYGKQVWLLPKCRSACIKPYWSFISTMKTWIDYRETLLLKAYKNPHQLKSSRQFSAIYLSAIFLHIKFKLITKNAHQHLFASPLKELCPLTFIQLIRDESLLSSYTALNNYILFLVTQQSWG